MQAGIPRTADFNGAQKEGAGYYQTTTNNKRRWSAAQAYLRPARKRQNLTIVTEAHATRVLIENGRAVGVEYRTPQGLADGARARRGHRVRRRLWFAASAATFRSWSGGIAERTRHQLVRDMPALAPTCTITSTRIARIACRSPSR